SHAKKSACPPPFGDKASPPRQTKERFMAGSAATRVRWTSVEGANELFTPAFLEYLLALHDRLAPRIQALLPRRAAALDPAPGSGQGAPALASGAPGGRRGVEGARGARRLEHARHRDLRPMLHHLHVHQRAQSGTGGRARRG